MGAFPTVHATSTAAAAAARCSATVETDAKGNPFAVYYDTFVFRHALSAECTSVFHIYRNGANKTLHYVYSLSVCEPWFTALDTKLKESKTAPRNKREIAGVLKSAWVDLGMPPLKDPPAPKARATSTLPLPPPPPPSPPPPIKEVISEPPLSPRSRKVHGIFLARSRKQ